MHHRFFPLIMFCLVLHVDALQAQVADESYSVQSIQTPEGVVAETGGITFLPDGRLAACFIRGEIMMYDFQKKNWELFAEGLHEPLGILAISDSEVVVMQRPELTRVKDTDGDGKADVFQTVTDDFGLSGNYHEFNYGPAKDKQGNFYIGLNTASPGGSVFPIVRGEMKPVGRDKQPGLYEMFSVVPYRGWVMKVTPAGEIQPYASGFRSPNGLGFDQNNNLFVTDNQSDWIETSALYHVKQGEFYGHPASLVWNKDWSKGNPFILPLDELNKIKKDAAVLFPQGIMANSPTEPVFDNTGGRFGPFSGQLFVGEMNRGRILRVMLENIGGQLQGACIPFIDEQNLRKGNNRLAFAPDGSLWIGQIAYGWSGDVGIQRIVFNGKQPFDLYTMKLLKDGFELTFTKPLASTASDLNNYQLRHYYYQYGRKAPNTGADIANQQDIKEVQIKKAELSADRKKIKLVIENLKAGYIYELKLDNIKDKSGKPLRNRLVCYTLNKLNAGR